MSVSLGIGAGPSGLCSVGRNLLVSSIDRTHSGSDARPLRQQDIEQKTQAVSDSISNPAGEGITMQQIAAAQQAIVPTFSQVDPPILVALDTHSMNLQWKAVEQLTPDPVQTSLPRCQLKYTLEMQRLSLPDGSVQPPAPLDKWSCCYEGSDTFVQVPGLRPGRRWSFRVLCSPACPAPYQAPPPQQPSQVVTFATPSTTPSAPHAPVLKSRFRRSLVWRWRQPDESGGQPISQYQFQFCLVPAIPPAAETDLDRDMQDVYSGLELMYRATQLVPGGQYAARVRASNSIGTSPWSAVAVFTTQATVPDEMQAPAVRSATANSLTVVWTPPADGGAAVDEYQLECDDGRGGPFQRVFTGMALERTVPQLQSGGQYRMRVTAINREGRGATSSYVLAHTLAACPDAPTDLRVTGVHNNTAAVHWQPPANNGGAPVTEYEVTLQPKSSTALNGALSDWQRAYKGASAACTASGLQQGCAYRIRVLARNTAGPGPHSRLIEFGTSPDVPAMPEPPRIVQRSQTELHLEWNAPAHDGGSTIQRYRLEMSRGSLAPQAEDSGQFSQVELTDQGCRCRATVDNLQPGSEYLFRLAAISTVGSSGFSKAVRACTKPAPPAQPQGVQLVSTTGSSMRLRWDAPASNGATITAYQVDRARGDLQHEQHPPSCSTSMGDLSAAVRQGSTRSLEAMEAEHLAAGGAGQSEVDASEQASTVSSLEDGQSRSDLGPTGKKGRRGHSKARDKTSTWQTVYNGADPCCETRGLEPFAEYAFRLRASSSAGHSDWSKPMTLRSGNAAPSCPLALHAQCSGSHAVDVQWQEPAKDHGCPVSLYSIEYSLGGTRARSSPSWQAGPSTASTSAQVDGLRHGREYMFRVRATNARGAGVWSEPVSADTQPAAPEAPNPPTFGQRTAISVRVKWDAPSEDNGAAILRYRLHGAINGGELRCCYSGAATAFKVPDLAPGAQCSFQVQASNMMGESELSAPATTTLLLLPPAPPTNLVVQPEATAPSDSPSLAVRWAPGEVSTQRAECVSHEVELQADGANLMRQTCSGRSRGCTLHAHLPQGTGKVRVRCVGSGSCGHGEPCNWVQFCLPNFQPPAAHSARNGLPAAPSSAAAPPRTSSTASSPSAAGTSRPRRAGGAVARPPPLRRTVMGVPMRQWRKLGRLLTNVVAVAAAIATFAIMIRIAVNDSSSKVVKGYQKEQLSPPMPSPPSQPHAHLP